MLLYPSNPVLNQTGSFWLRSLDAPSRDRLDLIGLAGGENAVFGLVDGVMDRLLRRGKFSAPPVLYKSAVILETVDGVSRFNKQVPFFPRRVILRGISEPLVPGLDYHLDVEGRIRFHTLVESEALLLLDSVSDEEQPSLFSPLYGAELKFPASGSALLADYIRGDHQNPEGFRRALRALAGLKRIPESSPVLRRSDVGATGGARYLLNNQAVTVPYPHDKVAVGDLVERGDVFGAELVDLFWNNGDPYWWRRNPELWDPYGQDFQGVVFTDSEETIIDVDGNLEFPVDALGGDDYFNTISDRFWSRVHARTEWGLDDLFDAGDTVNPLDFLYTYFFDHAMILALDADRLPLNVVFGVLRWFFANIPLGWFPVVRVKYDDVWLPLALLPQDITGAFPGNVTYNGVYVTYLGVPVVYNP